MNSTTISLGKVDNSCFVAMPFSSLFQIEYEKIIQPALMELNIQCIRGDEIYAKQRIVDDIWNSIKKCRFVLAELTGKNPNVLYEIGLAHAIGKPVLIITRNSDDVPFDLKALRYLYYDVNEPFWGENLKVGIQNLAKKVIENPTIEAYLEGISNNIKYPEISTEKSKPPRISNSNLELSGTWQGEFVNPQKTIHKVILQLNQEGSLLSAAAIISFFKGEKRTVVQQIMNASIQEETVNLVGVNYTYIEQGASSGYTLDNFTLKVKGGNNVLKGHVSSDEEGRRIMNTPIEFRKL